MGDLEKMTDWSKLKDYLEKDPLGKKSQVLDEPAFAEHLRSRVKGQDEVVDDVARLIRLSFLQHNRSRPICNLLFLGPTGTGKTELAKAISEFLYENEKDMLRFDCSELASGEMGKSRLVGSAPGFVGSEQGGQLTRPMFANPRRVILFDEIEKAHPSVFDLFLQMMGEGRLSEQASGKTADFTQSVIILTSNSHAEEIGQVCKGITDYHEMLNAIKSYLADSGVFRPEILGRIDKVYLFKPLTGLIVAEIALLKVAKLGAEYGLKVRFVSPELVMKALEANVKVSRFGIRELERILFDLFAPCLAEASAKRAKEITFDLDSKGKIFWTEEGGAKKP